MSETGPGGTQLLSVSRLSLDDTNPRLPEGLRKKSQSEILRFFYHNGVLEELAQSYIDNGFFQHEPLIVVPNGQDERYTVVEGNRRLAALKILHNFPEADELSLVTIDPPKEKLDGLREVPCFVIDDRDAVRAYVGFRHIGALKTWPPEAKARYLLSEVRRLASNKVPDPFRDLGRRVGSNAQGVRNPYLAIRILLHAREEFSLDIKYVQDRRFGVWLRCMTSADIRAYIGLERATTYDEIEDAVSGIVPDNLDEVLGDLRSEGREKPVLGDSREVTTYGRALMDARAHATLRRTNDLSIAKQIIEESDLDIRARELVQRTQIFMEILQRAEDTEISNDLLAATDELFSVTRSTRAIVKDRIDNRDSEP